MDNSTKRAILIGVYDSLMETFYPGAKRNVMQSELTYEQELYIRNLKVNIEEIINKPNKLDKVIGYFSNTEEYEVCTDLAEIKNAIEENGS
tara:strand:+ start:6646 stop:6918 length:273 start_codon:yes stop_codon:yes gene_type:complete